MKTLISVLGILLFFGLSSGRASDDFLIVIADDVSAIRFGSNVRPSPTASLDRLARGATVFKQAYCPASVCHPSRTAMLTCKPPNETGIYTNSQHSRNLPTVLHYLKGQGYRLRAVGRIFHTGEEQNSVFSKALDPSPRAVTKVELRKGGFGAPLKIGVNQAPAKFGDAGLKAQRAIEEIRKSKPSAKNGFLVGFSATHLPFIVPNSRRYSRAYPSRRIKLPSSRSLGRPEFAPVPNRKYRISPRKQKDVISRYYGCLRYVSDEATGVIRAFRKKYPNGHVAFVSDHGFLLGEERSWGKSSTLEAVCRVPYFVWSNQLPAGVVEGPISTGTVFPLLLDLCGVPAYEQASWTSPRDWILAGRTPVDHVVYTYGGPTQWRSTLGKEVNHYRKGNVHVTGLDDRPK